ncbi:uncharacterized protein JCM6883_002747 [Sporobolomyces salmoneus]|uniref:uncharacterized protein n=1 Tax=Sporobolomyces salmoneus TaxID=183962 RepID=UPI00316CF454
MVTTTSSASATSDNNLSISTPSESDRSESADTTPAITKPRSVNVDNAAGPSKRKRLRSKAPPHQKAKEEVTDRDLLDESNGLADQSEDDFEEPERKKKQRKKPSKGQKSEGRQVVPKIQPPAQAVEQARQPIGDFIKPDMGIVICGMYAPHAAQLAGRYYADENGHPFWKFLHDSGLTNRLLTSYEAETLRDEFDIGMTVLGGKLLAKGEEPTTLELKESVPVLLQKIVANRTRLLVYNSKKVGERIKVYLKKRNSKLPTEVKFGLQPMFISLPPRRPGLEREKIHFWCLPGVAGANSTMTEAGVQEDQLEEEEEKDTLEEEDQEPVEEGPESGGDSASKSDLSSPTSSSSEEESDHDKSDENEDSEGASEGARTARSPHPSLNLAKQTDLNAFFGLSTSSPSPSRSTSNMAATKRKTVKSESKSPTPKRSRTSASPVKKEEPDSDFEGDLATLKKPLDHGDEIHILPDLMHETPLAKLYEAMKDLSETKGKETKPSKAGIVVYWMRNKDLRIKDNTALSHASAFAQSNNLPLVVLHIFSPGDYKAHDRSPRRIDFQLRQLKYLQEEFGKHDIPLFTFSHDKRKEIPSVVCKKLEEWGAAGMFANLEYEVDELRRDTEILKSVKEARKSGKGFGGRVDFLRDLCVVAPGDVVTKQGKPYAVFSPFFRNWAEKVNSDLLTHIGENNDDVKANDKSARSHSVLREFFSHSIPTSIKGFELTKEDQETMEKLWPVGEAVDSVLKRFLETKIREQTFFEPPLYEGAEDAKDPKKDSKIGKYTTGRNRVDWDGTSHLSPYLAAGFISRRQCLREVYKLNGSKALPTERDSGTGMWVQEVAGWGDFYVHVLCAWPRVCMTQPFNLKYTDIQWTDDPDDKLFTAWKEGKTGFPIVDAGMRALNAQGYMHNRCRMIVAMFLSKDLLLDWRRGEKYFMEKLIDGDFAPNNGGWQWSASTGCDPQPYFRVFNPTSQSEKSDPSGEYIRHWVPELRSLKGKSIHAPSAAEIKKTGYVQPIVDHSKARVKAIEAFKNA